MLDFEKPQPPPSLLLARDVDDKRRRCMPTPHLFIRAARGRAGFQLFLLTVPPRRFVPCLFQPMRSMAIPHKPPSHASGHTSNGAKCCYMKSKEKLMRHDADFT